MDYSLILSLFVEFFKIGLFAVGGGPATLPFLMDLAIERSEFDDLKNKCDWTWQTNYKGVDGANGYLVTGKGEYAGNSIFIPAAGYRIDQDSYKKGSLGHYWTSSPNAGVAHNAFYLSFESVNVSFTNGNRYRGYTYIVEVRFFYRPYGRFVASRPQKSRLHLSIIIIPQKTLLISNVFFLSPFGV